MVCAIFLLWSVAACSTSAPKPETPLDSLKTYAAAFRKKDYTTMKLLLSSETIKMHQQTAKEQNVTLDDIVGRETLFLPDQKNYVTRNQKIDGDRATIEIKNSNNKWDTVNFVKEEGIWKLDRKTFADQIIEQNEQDNKKIDEIFNRNSQPE